MLKFPQRRKKRMKYRVDLSKETTDKVIIGDVAVSDSRKGAKEAATIFEPLVLKDKQVFDPEDLNVFLDEWNRSYSNGQVQALIKAGNIVPLDGSEKKAETKKVKAVKKVKVSEVPVEVASKAIPKSSAPTGDKDFDKLTFRQKMDFLAQCVDKQMLEKLIKAGISASLEKIAQKSLKNI